MYGDTLAKTRSEDGNNYYFSNWYGLEQYPVFGFMMRMDIMKELGVGDKVNNGEPFTAEEFEELLVKFRRNIQPSTERKHSDDAQRRECRSGDRQLQGHVRHDAVL